jgi:putative hydrolase of the HAD superfamily
MSAVLCDLDGLLIDSEGLHYEAYKVMLKEYGIDLSVDMFVESWLGGKQYGTRYYLQKAGVMSEEELDRARRKKADLYCEMSKGKVKFMPGAEDFLKRVKEAGIKCAVGTGGYKKEYTFAANEVGLFDYAQAFVGGDEVDRNKPAPDIFLEAARQLDEEPSNCVVFENSDIGMNAGLSANMRCIVIPSEYTTQQNFEGATQQFQHMDEVDLSQLF